MSKYPLTTSLGIHIEYEDMPGAYVSAVDLEKVLSEAQEVFGTPEKYQQNTVWFNTEQENTSQRARVLCLQPIKREPMKVEFNGNLTKNNYTQVLGDLDPQMHKFFGKRVKVTVEEVVEEKGQADG